MISCPICVNEWVFLLQCSRRQCFHHVMRVCVCSWLCDNGYDLHANRPKALHIRDTNQCLVSIMFQPPSLNMIYPTTAAPPSGMYELLGNNPTILSSSQSHYLPPNYRYALFKQLSSTLGISRPDWYVSRCILSQLGCAWARSSTHWCPSKPTITRHAWAVQPMEAAWHRRQGRQRRKSLLCSSMPSKFVYVLSFHRQVTMADTEQTKLACRYSTSI